MFEVVYVRPATHPITDLDGYQDSAEQIEGGAYWIEPRLREEMVILTEENGAGRSILRQVPLHLGDSHIVTGRGVPE